MPSQFRWHLRGADGTTLRREARITDALADGVPPGATLKRERVTMTRGPQPKRALAPSEAMPPVVPTVRSLRPAEPFPGERIDSNGNAIRPAGWYVTRHAAPNGRAVEVLRDFHGRDRARRDAGDIC